ncbi:RICIN domain-containing protein [Amycolatopsis sp. Hca4]|uniref:RICIN domain-containing protein n=1 Tax=Amycolatopsis sp. Hca4 TaxID=2742131 RepID=UPI0020CAF20C|nr:RICIN domain-containing protein [Amycolatopsis sp. Hca4]
MRLTRSAGARHRIRKPHRGRPVAIALALGVPAFAAPHLLFTRDGAEPVRVDSASYYLFLSVRDGSALDAAGGGATSRQWRLEPVGGGYCLLVNRDSGKVLAVRASATEVAEVEQQPGTGAAAQQWQLRDTGGGALKIVSRSGGMVLGVTEGTGRRAVARSADRGGADQRWTLAKAADPGAATRVGAGPDDRGVLYAEPATGS